MSGTTRMFLTTWAPSGSRPRRDGGVVETVVGVLDLKGRRIVLDREIGRIVRVRAAHERLVHPAGTGDVAV